MGGSFRSGAHQGAETLEPDSLVSAAIERMAPRGQPRLRAFVGFDGFLDRIVRVVAPDRPSSSALHFRTIEDFTAYMASKGGNSFTLELDGTSVRLGGNAPIMSAALARLGASVRCVGALGEGTLRPEFRMLEDLGCEVLGIAEPGETTALEFSDGKIMLTQIRSLDAIDWHLVGTGAVREFLQPRLAECDVVGLVNWSELRNATEIWKGMRDELAARDLTDKRRLILFDLADCSRRSKDSILEVADLIGSYSDVARTVLSLNENEARRLGIALDLGDGPIEDVGAAIFADLGVDICIVHTRASAMGWAENSFTRASSFMVPAPVLTTGAGDNFNAGFCFAWQRGLTLGEALGFGNAVAACYLRDGSSPTLVDLGDFLTGPSNKTITKEARRP